MEDAGASSAQIDDLIAPEIHGDKFYRAIARVAASPTVRTILEIGSSSGQGSTEALVEGAIHQAVPPEIHCVEVVEGRVRALRNRWADFSFVHCHRTSSVTIDEFPSPEEVAAFYGSTRSKLRRWPLETVLGWLAENLEYLEDNDLSRPGIENIKRESGIDVFDAVLIDGSEFTGRAELAKVYGARFLMLDDIRTFKNWENYHSLMADPTYRRRSVSRFTRNGFAVFELRR